MGTQYPFGFDPYHSQFVCRAQPLIFASASSHTYRLFALRANWTINIEKKYSLHFEQRLAYSISDT